MRRHAGALVTARERRLLAHLRFIACAPQAYHSRGPEFVRDEMERVAREAIQAEAARAKRTACARVVTGGVR
jgi:hypothetical protein